MYKFTLLFVVSCIFLWAEEKEFSERFIERQIEKAKDVAEDTKDVLVVAENETKALLIFCNGNFKSVRLHTRKRNFGMNIKGMDFILFDKKNGKEIVFKHPERFRSFFADSKNIKIRKGYFQSYNAIASSSGEFFKKFVLQRKKRRGKSKNDFVDLRIFNFQENTKKSNGK